MSFAYFVSDIHLKKMASPQGEAFLRLLDQALNDAGLFVILGDLFDLWVGQGAIFQKEYKPILDRIHDLKKKCRVLYFEGNHDLHLKKFWQDQLGCEVYTQPHVFDFEGIRIWAEHGDEINREDKNYLWLRWFLRTPVIKAIITNAPSTWVKAVGDRASKQSRKYSGGGHSNPGVRELYRNYAQKIREKNEFELIITGHSHIADDYKFETPSGTGRLINLGSWFDGPKYLKLEASDQGFEASIRLL